MIYGVTKSKEGEPIERLPVTTKVAIGLPADENRNYPSRLDHFIFLRKIQADVKEKDQSGKATGKTHKDVKWVEDDELTKIYGKECKEFDIVLMSDDIEAAFPHQLAWWTRTEKKCWGDGVVATRRTPENPKGVKWPVCAEGGCKDFERGDCKPSADLYFMLAARPRLGELCRIHTSSYRSTRQLYSSLVEFYEKLGRLAGIKMTLRVSPEIIKYEESGKAKSSVAYILSLTIHADSIQKALSAATEGAMEFQRVKKLLVGDVTIGGNEPEEELATEITAEFVGNPDQPEKAEQQPTQTEVTSEVVASSSPHSTSSQASESDSGYRNFSGTISKSKESNQVPGIRYIFRLTDVSEIFGTKDLPAKPSENIEFKAKKRAYDGTEFYEVISEICLQRSAEVVQKETEAIQKAMISAFDFD